MSGAAEEVTGGLLSVAMRIGERFGIPVVLLSVVLWWARTDLIQPLLDAHFSFLDRITNAHDKHVEELRNIGSKLDTLIRVTDDK